MGSLETGVSLKRENFPRSSSSAAATYNKSNIHSFLQKPRSRKFSRFLLFKKLDYLQWICTVAVFFFFVLVFQMFLPGSVVLMEDEKNAFEKVGFVSKDLGFVKLIDGLDFGDDLMFQPSSKLLGKFQKESSSNSEVDNASGFNRTKLRFGLRKPLLALVFADLSVHPEQIMMVTVAAALREIGYEIQVYSLEDGPAHMVWENISIPVTVIQMGDNSEIPVDWLSYDAVLVNSLDAKGILCRFLQEPFKSLPLIWTIHEEILATRLQQYNSTGQTELVNDWKKIFSRSTVVVFPNYVLPMMYSPMDAGNFFVIPGSPTEAWEADHFIAPQRDNVRLQMGYEPNDFVITIVGSQILYKGLWLEHALILQALFSLLPDFPSPNISSSHLKIVVLSGDSNANYSVAVETIALNLRYPSGIVRHVCINGNDNNVLEASDIVIYGSFHEEQSFPDILIKTMCLGKSIVAPDLSLIRKYVDDRVNGYLFPKENIKILTEIIRQMVSDGKLSREAHDIALNGKGTAKNMMTAETVEGYSKLVENILRLPSEVTLPKAVSEIPPQYKEKWQWDLFEAYRDSVHANRTLRSYNLIDKIERQWNQSRAGFGVSTSMDESFVYSIWEEEKYNEMAYIRKKREDDELKDRTDQPRGTWEDVYRSVKRADRSKNDLHERDDGELERTGQPLTIYEPYFGEGAWPFLHLTSLYRGIGLSTRARRTGTDDIDAPSRLSILSNPYYRDALGEYGAFFALANRIDRVHKNAWIGFQSWRATAGKASLSKVAEKALLEAIQSRKHGDTLYFWARMDTDKRNPLKQDFWSFCDAINAGNCQFAVSEALKKVYGVNHDFKSLLPMPRDGDSWSVLSSWALPTRSFLEFVMFSRMFVDALDSGMYDQHHLNGHCYLCLYKDKHCYSRVLELLVNIWAYHSARRMVYINPETGSMQEHHKLKSRKGHIRYKLFSYATLKSLDEDLAEEFDVDHPSRRWLWPLTGEVFWQGMYEREKNLRQQQKEKKKRLSKEKISRIKKRGRQKVIGKFVKPPPDEIGDSNSTDLKASVLR